MARRQSQETCQGVKPRVEARSAGQEGRQGQEAGPGGRARRPGQEAGPGGQARMLGSAR